MRRWCLWFWLLALARSSLAAPVSVKHVSGPIDLLHSNSRGQNCPINGAALLFIDTYQCEDFYNQKYKSICHSLIIES